MKISGIFYEDFPNSKVSPLSTSSTFYDEPVKSRHSREGGNPENCNFLKILDSRLRGNDTIGEVSTFYEAVIYNESMVRGFGPIAAENAQALVLGTLPGRQSLAKGQYYAHPQNAFWFIMERLFRTNTGGDYQKRLKMLKRARIALWDVLAGAERNLSVDTAIVAGSEEVNDFVDFFQAHQEIHTVFFNGANAETLFRRLALPLLPHVQKLSLMRLPSTSPANARLAINEKLEAWRIITDQINKA